MLDKKITLVIVFGLFLAVVNVILAFIYEYLINSFFEDNYYEDLRSFYRVKYIYGDSINNLQLIIFIYDLLYTSIFFLANNKKILNFFSLNFNSIATQNQSDLSNFFLELFFACLIKLIPLIINIVISFISLDSLKTTLDNSLQTRKILSKLDYSYSILILFLTLNLCITLLFLALYSLKLVSQLKEKPTKAKEDIIVKENSSSTEGNMGLSSNSFLSLTRSSKQEQLINE